MCVLFLLFHVSVHALDDRLTDYKTYIELSRDNPEAQFQKIKDDNPYGFDIVVEATGSPKILEDAINYVRRGGKLVGKFKA